MQQKVKRSFPCALRAANNLSPPFWKRRPFVQELALAESGFKECDRLREPFILARKALAEAQLVKPRVQVQRVFGRSLGAALYRGNFGDTIKRRIASWAVWPRTAPALKAIDWLALRSRLLQAPPSWQICIVKTLAGWWVTERRMSQKHCQ
eukprot:8539580-Pyramimonas_sp.AAC.1